MGDTYSAIPAREKPTSGNAGSGNVASDSAVAGVQAEAIHGNVTLYVRADDASAEETYRTGVNYLDGGMPIQARRYIREAITRGYDTSEVRFHWLLALTSGRTFRQLSDDDLASFRVTRTLRLPETNDEWADGVRAILRLVESAEDAAAEPRLAISRLDELGPVQCGKILRHLELFLDGQLEDLVWDRELKRAEREQRGGNREGRVWKFFQPKPEEPRVRPPVPAMITVPQWIAAITTGTVFAAAVVAIGWELVQRGSLTALTAYLISAAGGCLCGAASLRSRFWMERARAEYKRFSALPRGLPPRGGFASNVDRLFNHYFARYVPDDADRETWLMSTAGIRTYLRDEMVDAYRGKRVSADEVAWLIRHRVSAVRGCWRAGGFTGQPAQLRTGPVARAAVVAGLAVCAVGGFWGIVNATRTDVWITVVATAVAAFGGLAGMSSWFRILLERKRASADREEARQRLADDWNAYHRWCAKLADRPTDSEMAAWLDCDRKMLIAEAMRQYALLPSRTITHAVLEAPALTYKRGRVRSGPWRYSRYHLLVFLLTDDGVRQVAADLDFAAGTFHDRVRLNFRFDAVAAVRVVQYDDYRRTFELGLVSGESIQARVTEPRSGELDGEDAESLSRVALDAASLPNTLHVLEGIAAEGKEWIVHERRRQEHRRDQVREAQPPAA